MPIFDLAFRFRYIKNLWSTVLTFFAQVKGLFGTFGIVDIVDILLVTVFLFFVIRLLRETRAFQLVKGLIFFAFAYFVVNFFGLGASSYILRLVFSNILIIVVVLFGPEIRKILEQMGKRTSNGMFSNLLNSGMAVEIAEMNNTIDAVCKAFAEMSSDKIGALVVFENDTLLGNFIDSGTTIEATASKELICNVFYPKSPLHDGAMIIRGSKVYAAGCILPLTNDTSISSSFGTRHRAAIGVSEQSDAIVFVVSEETGTISYAENGTLKTNLSTGDVRDILIKNYIPNGNNDEKIFSKLTRGFKK